MARMSRRAWLGCLPMVVAGCARYAVRPPTPAVQYDQQSLNYASPGERFFCLIFASQSILKRPAYAHTWMTVVRALDRPGRCPEVADVNTLSWLPASLDVRPLRLKIEPGVNLTLQEALVFAESNRERVSLWGPYECRPSLYRRFLIQKEFIESGRIGYQCNDNFGEAARTGDGCCCIHAISDMDPRHGRANYPLIWFGDAASEHLVDHYYRRHSFIDPEIEHDWLLEPLGLAGHRIVRRRHGDRLIDFPRLQPGGPRPAPDI